MVVLANGIGIGQLEDDCGAAWKWVGTASPFMGWPGEYRKGWAIMQSVAIVI
jgi:hypothetical protein